MTRTSTRIDRRTGKLRWKLQTDGPVHATPAVQNGIVYIAGCDERFRAVSVADGKVLFEIPLGSYTGASTAVSGERAYVGTFDAELFALDLAREENRCGATAIPSGSFRTIRRRRSTRRSARRAAPASSSADATRRSTR